MSYTQADRAWAEWIAWLLEEDGYRVLIQLPPPEYLELFTTRATEMYGRGRVADHQHTISTLWSLSLDRLRARCAY